MPKRKNQQPIASSQNESRSTLRQRIGARLAAIDWRGGGNQKVRAVVEQVTWLLSLATARTALIVVAVFIIDALTPLGISVGVLYMAAVLSAVPIRHRWAVFITGGICCMLVFVGWAISPGRGETELWKILLNRLLVLGVIGAAMGMAEAWRRLQERRLRQLQESRLLHQAMALGAAEGSFHDALKNSVRALCDILGWPVGHVYMRQTSGKLLLSSDTWNLPDDGRFELLKTAISGARFAPGEGVPGRIWQTGRAIAVADIAHSADYAWLKEAERLGVKGAFAFPLIVGGEVAAVVEFFSEHEINVDPEFSSLANNVGQQLGRLFERRRTDLALRKSEERLRLAFTGGHLGTWEWQLDTGRVLWSPELEEIHGFEPETFGGTFEAFEELIHPEDRQQVLDTLQAAVQSRDEFHCEYRFLRPDGAVQWIEGRGAVHNGTEGRAARMIGVCMDITQRKQVEVETRRAKEAAESANRLRGQFLANVSHELRTPMNAILGMLQLALAGQDLSDELREELETAKRSADSLLVLLNDVLDFSRIEADGLRIQARPMSLRETLEDTVWPLAAQAFEKGLELICHVADDVPDGLEGDADRLRQVMTNLISNAVKFTDQGEVVVRVQREQQLLREARIRFTVSDTGVGIAEADWERIFQPFVQGDATTTRKHGGVGLGLAISSELVRRMGGNLSLESEPGAGSEFSFSLTFPVLHDDERDHRQPRPLSYQRLAGLPVLIVDDNQTNREMLVQILDSWSMQPEAAVDGDHALGKLFRAQTENRSYPLVLVDAKMPGMNGVPLARRITDEFEHAPPVVLMLSTADRQYLAGADLESIAGELEKPISPSRLLDVVMTVLNVQSAGNHSSAAPAASTPTSRPLRVLLAEDTPANQKVMVSILQRRGHAVTIANNGSEAFELVQRNSFDVVLMDVQMPLMDGYAATAAIRKLDRQRDMRTPIVAMTAHAMQGDREKCLAAGMDTYLAKPIDVEQLLEVVEGIVRDGKAATPKRADESAPGKSQGGSLVMDLPATLKRLSGDRQLLIEFVQVFDEDAPALMESIAAAVAHVDAADLERAAHRLKGIAANIGARAVTEQAAELEYMAAAAALSGAAEVLAQLEREMARLDAALSEFRPQRLNSP